MDGLNYRTWVSGWLQTELRRLGERDTYDTKENVWRI